MKLLEQITRKLGRLTKKPDVNYRAYIVSKPWREKSNHCLVSTRKHCCLFWGAEASHSHHLHYKNLGDEKNFRDIVPLSRTAHKIIHWSIFWKIKPVRRVINQILRVNYLIVKVFFSFQKEPVSRRKIKVSHR